MVEGGFKCASLAKIYMMAEHVAAKLAGRFLKIGGAAVCAAVIYHENMGKSGALQFAQQHHELFVRIQRGNHHQNLVQCF